MLLTAKLNDWRNAFWQDWVCYQGSLTDKLQACTGEAVIKVIDVRWRNTSWWASYVLTIRDRRVLEREIVMSSHGCAYWYAKTLVPDDCFQQDPGFFNRLYDETTKHLIFNEPKVQRVMMRCYPVTPECIEYYWVSAHVGKDLISRGIQKKPLWVRISQFSFQKSYDFYLVEVLLPMQT